MTPDGRSFFNAEKQERFGTTAPKQGGWAWGTAVPRPIDRACGIGLNRRLNLWGQMQDTDERSS